MSEELLEKFIEEYINSQTMPPGIVHLARRRDTDASALFLQTGLELQRKYAKRTHHRQLYTDQRHVAHRRMVPVLQGEQLAGGCLHRRAAGVP